MVSVIIGGYLVTYGAMGWLIGKGIERMIGKEQPIVTVRKIGKK